MAPGAVTFDGGGVRLVGDAYGESGGRPVVFLHGAGQTRHAWARPASLFGGRGWSALTLDLRGHGDSGWSPDGVYDLDAFAGDAARVAGSFARPVALVGASLGGLSALVAVGEASEPEALASALVLVDIVPRMEGKGVQRVAEFMLGRPDGFASLEEVADAIAAFNPHRERPSNLEGLKKNVRQREDGRWVWHWDPRFFQPPPIEEEDDGATVLASYARISDAATRIEVPTLLVRGSQSDIVGDEGVRHLLELIPHAEVADVSGAGHMVVGDRNDLFNDAVVEFLERVVPDVT